MRRPITRGDLGSRTTRSSSRREWAGALSRSGGRRSAAARDEGRRRRGTSVATCWPEFLPGGKAVLYTVFTGGSLEDYADRRLADRDRRAEGPRSREGPSAATRRRATFSTRARARFSRRAVRSRSGSKSRARPSPSPTGSSRTPTAARATPCRATERSCTHRRNALAQRARSVWVDRKGAKTPVDEDQAAIQRPDVSRPTASGWPLSVEAETY